MWGITARNREQNFALNLLMDPEIDFVTVLGPAGTGKTLLALAAGLMQTLETNRFVEIIMTRVTIPLGEDIGFLPGTEEEKMEPWMGALMDNLEVLTQSQEGGNWGRAATNDLLRNRIKIRSLNFMRGRTFLNRYIILDEAQNLTPKQMKALDHARGPGHQARLPRQHRADRHAVSHRDDLGPHLLGEPLPGLAALRAHHAGARRALAARGLRLGYPVSGPAELAGPRTVESPVTRCDTCPKTRLPPSQPPRVAPAVALRLPQSEPVPCALQARPLWQRALRPRGRLSCAPLAEAQPIRGSSELPDIGNPAGALVTRK